MPGIRKPGPIAPRFWRKVDIKGVDECWLWLASFGFRDYGKFKLNGTYVAAHRIAYELTFGPIEKGKIICHKCDNPSCCNPYHLFQGTQSDNNADKYRKGRGANQYYRQENAK